MILTIDSYAWIELLRGGPAAQAVEKNMREAIRRFVSAITLPEVAIRLARDSWSPTEISHALHQIGESAELVPVDIDISLSAPGCVLELRKNASKFQLSTPGLADAFVLATARFTGSRVLTGDPHFRGLNSTEWIGRD